MYTNTKRARNGFNQAKHDLPTSKAHKIFLEDKDNIDFNDTYKIRNVHPPTSEENVVNKEGCDNNLSSKSNKKS